MPLPDPALHLAACLSAGFSSWITTVGAVVGTTPVCGFCGALGEPGRRAVDPCSEGSGPRTPGEYTGKRVLGSLLEKLVLKGSLGDRWRPG